MENKVDELNSIVNDIQELDWVEDAFIDDDCAPEGCLTVQVVIKEEEIDNVCKELGYNSEEWESEDE